MSDRKLSPDDVVALEDFRKRARAQNAGRWALNVGVHDDATPPEETEEAVVERVTTAILAMLRKEAERDGAPFDPESPLVKRAHRLGRHRVIGRSRLLPSA